MAIEVVCASKNIRAEIKNKVISVQTSKTEAHKKTTDTIATKMQEAKAKKVTCESVCLFGILQVVKFMRKIYKQ